MIRQEVIYSVFLDIRQRYVTSEVTSGEFIHSLTFDHNPLFDKGIITQAVQQFLDWDDSPEIFSLRFIDDVWTVGDYECAVCGSGEINPDPDFPESMTTCERCGSEWITGTGEITLNGREVE